MHNCFDRTIVKDVFPEPLQLRRMASHAHQNLAHLKEIFSQHPIKESLQCRGPIENFQKSGWTTIMNN